MANSRPQTHDPRARSGPRPRDGNERVVGLVFKVWSRFYDFRLPQQLYYRRIHRRILERWQPARGEAILDVGCGTGLFLDELAQRFDGVSLTGVDLSPDMLREARLHARAGSRSGGSPKPNFIEASVYELPFESSTFDVVLNTISCHFYLEQVRAFREIARVLRPGGRFYLAAITFGPRTPPFGFAVYHPEHVLLAHLREAGFELVARERIRPATVLLSVRRI